MNKIDILNISGLAIKTGDIRKAANGVLKDKKIQGKEISITLIDKDKIRQLNKKFRNLDKVTDVLSFEIKDEKFLGEIIISPEIVLERSEEKDFDLKLSRTLIHGILHLLGYDHIKKKSREEMRKEEERISYKVTK